MVGLEGEGEWSGADPRGVNRVTSHPPLKAI